MGWIDYSKMLTFEYRDELRKHSDRWPMLLTSHEVGLLVGMNMEAVRKYRGWGVFDSVGKGNDRRYLRGSIAEFLTERIEFWDARDAGLTY